MHSTKLLAAALLSLACGSWGGQTDATGSSSSTATTSLDGLWNFTSLPPSFFGARATSGLLLARGTTYKGAIYQPNRPGLVASGPCTIGTDTTFFTIDLTPATDGQPGSGTGVISVGNQGDACDDVVPIFDVKATQTKVQPATFTPYDGDWLVTFSYPRTDAAIEGAASFTLHVAGTSWTAGGPVHAHGAITGDTSTSTDGDSTVVLERDPDYPGDAGDLFLGP